MVEVHGESLVVQLDACDVLLEDVLRREGQMDLVVHVQIVFEESLLGDVGRGHR